MEEIQILNEKIEEALKVFEKDAMEFFKSQKGEHPEKYIAKKSAKLCASFVTYRCLVNYVQSKLNMVKIELQELKEQQADSQQIENASKLVDSYEAFTNEIKEQSLPTFTRISVVLNMLESSVAKPMYVNIVAEMFSWING